MDAPGVVVAGASSDIGRAIAVLFAGRGNRLHLWGRDHTRLEETRAACAAAGAAEVESTSLDVLDRVRLRAAATAATDAGPITAVVWAAGQFQWGRFDGADEGVMDAVVDTVFTAAVVAARAFLPALIQNAPSALIFIGSGAGRQAYPNNAAYVSAKHGLRGLAEALHLDVCELGVKVSVVSAGLVNAGAGRNAPAAASHPRGMLQPADLARAVEFIIDSPANVSPTEIVLRPSIRGT